MDRIYHKRSDLRGAVVVSNCGALYGCHGEGVVSKAWAVGAERIGADGRTVREFWRGRTTIVLPVEYREGGE